MAQNHDWSGRLPSERGREIDEQMGRSNKKERMLRFLACIVVISAVCGVVLVIVNHVNNIIEYPDYVDHSAPFRGAFVPGTEDAQVPLTTNLDGVVSPTPPATVPGLCNMRLVANIDSGVREFATAVIHGEYCWVAYSVDIDGYFGDYIAPHQRAVTLRSEPGIPINKIVFKVCYFRPNVTEPADNECYTVLMVRATSTG